MNVSSTLRKPAIALLSLGVAALAIVVPAGPASAAPNTANPATVQRGYTDSATPTVAYNVTNSGNFPLGTTVDSSSVAHTSRVYATFNVASLFQGQTISSAFLRVTEIGAGDCTKRAIEAWQTDAVTATPTWNTAPAEQRKLDEILTPEFCPNANISFDVTAAFDASADRLTFELRVPDQFESDPSYRRTLSRSKGIVLAVYYNTAPTIDNANLYNGGHPCTSEAPYRTLSADPVTLQALGFDADQPDKTRLRYYFAMWPVNDPSARMELDTMQFLANRVGTVQFPESRLSDGTTYAWQARVWDGAAYSAWSKTCYLTYDLTKPSPPTVTSANYPTTGDTPLGELGVFTFDGGGDPDVAGFRYYFSNDVWVCTIHGGSVGQDECPDVFSHPDSVQADAPGGTASITLSPPSSGTNVLRVFSLDSAGNQSDEVDYQFNAPGSEPSIIQVDGPPQQGDPITLRLTPAPGVAGTTSYEYKFLSGSTASGTLTAAADGSATLTVPSVDQTAYIVSVRGRSANGFVTTRGQWAYVFQPGPGVESDVYVKDWAAHGGAGVTGSFRFGRPFGSQWFGLQGYQYSLNGADPTFVAAGTDGRATVDLTPSASGTAYLEVSAVAANGEVSSSTYYEFQVA